MGLLSSVFLTLAAGGVIPDRAVLWMAASGTFDQALEWLYFSLLEVDHRGRVTLRYVNGAGPEIYRQQLAPAG